jgi:hypothetical protein
MQDTDRFALGRGKVLRVEALVAPEVVDEGLGDLHLGRGF